MPENNPSRRMTLRDRINIEDALREGQNINAISKMLGFTWRAIAKELRNHRTTETTKFLTQRDRNLCVRRDECLIEGLCTQKCRGICATCRIYNCNRSCTKFEAIGMCPRLKKAPYVCNPCHLRLGRGCEFEYWFYDAREAHEIAKNERVEARQGVSCTPEELKEMVETIKPLLKKGQSLEHIWQTHRGDFPVGFRTFYRYISLGVLDIINLDLPKKVRYKERKKKLVVPFRTDLVGKTYQDFLNIPFEDQLSVVEMDCVCGKSTDKKAILTLYFRRFCFQLMILLPTKTQESVGRALEQIELFCGKDGFKTHFKSILCDRGSEFMDPSIIENSKDGQNRCKVYYCDPMKSGQRGAGEKNHVEIRKIIPKGTSLNNLSAYELAHVCSHVNSYTRPQLGGVSPYSIASQILPKDLLEGFGVEYVPPDDVILKPTFFKDLGLRE